MQFPIFISHHNNTFPRHRHYLVRSWMRQCISAANKEPHFAKNTFLFLFKNSRIIVIATRKCRKKWGMGADRCRHKYLDGASKKRWVKFSPSIPKSLADTQGGVFRHVKCY